MRNLTTGSISTHLLLMALPMAVGMIVQTLYYLVDLYFVARLGDAALAGVSAAGNIYFLVMAFTQILNVGTVALVAHAVGRDDRVSANQIFNQSVGLALLLTVVTLVGSYTLAGGYIETLGADAATIKAGKTYLNWFTPCLALMFVPTAMAAALRGTGIVKPVMIIQLLTVLINIVLAPVLIAGWGTGQPMGVAGAGLASSLATGAGVVALMVYFVKLEKYVVFDRSLAKPSLAIWKRVLAIGFPAGAEFLLLFLFMAVIFWVIRDFGAAAQAGYGMGSRLMQAIFLPAMAIAFSAPAVAGQNFGAGLHGRVRETFRVSVIMSSAIMLVLTLICQWRPEWFVAPFTQQTDVIAVSAEFLRIMSLNFVATGVIFSCSGLFQALGNTWPSLISSATRIITFVLPAVWLSQQAGFQLKHVWYLSVATVTLQAVFSVWLLRGEFRRRLGVETAPG